MKNRILFISLAVMLALSIGLTGCADGVTRAPSDKIVIGMSRSLHGSLAIIHYCAFGSVLPAFMGRVNGAPNNGITVDGQQFLIDTVTHDDNSNPETLAANTAILISEVARGEVHTIFGPTCTYFIDVMAPLVNDAEMVLMAAEGGGSFLIEYPGPPPMPGPINNMPYVFLHLSFSDWYQLPVLATLLDEAHYDEYGAHNATAWIVWQDDAHGLEYLYSAEALFPAANITILGNTPVLDKPSYSYATKLAEIAAANPDILCLFCYPGEIFGYSFTAIGMAINFDAVVAGPGACFGNFGIGVTGLGAAAEGVTIFAVGNNATSSDSDPITDATLTMEELFNDIIAGGDPEGQDFWGHPLYWAALEIWQNAVEQVGYVQDGGFMIDQDALKNELAGYNSEVNGVNTVLGPTWYTMFGAGNGGGILAYECHTGQIGQWRNGYVEVVAPTNVINATGAKVPIASLLPKYRATSDTFIYPKPDWPS